MILTQLLYYQYSCRLIYSSICSIAPIIYFYLLTTCNAFLKFYQVYRVLKNESYVIYH